MIKASSAQRVTGAHGFSAPRPCPCQLYRRLPIAAGLNDENASTSTSAPASPPTPPVPEPKYSRTFKALGSEVIEQNESFEEPPPQDMWEGEKFEKLGQFLEKYFVPFLVVLGLVCGGYAASTYNEDADVFIKPSTGPDELPTVVPAAALQQAPPLSS